ncbi:hypothetical protein D9C01_13645, partial [Corynebacterium diphtheriae]
APRRPPRGGKALKFYASVRIRRPPHRDPQGGRQPRRQPHPREDVKNKMAPPFKLPGDHHGAARRSSSMRPCAFDVRRIETLKEAG